MTSSSLRKTIRPWLENVATYYLSEYSSDEDENDVSMNLFTDNAMNLIEEYLKKHPEMAKKKWQDFTLASALASFQLLHLEVDTSQLWDRCRGKCDDATVKATQAEMMSLGKAPAAETKAPAAPAPAPKQDAPAKEDGNESDGSDDGIDLEEVSDDDAELNTFRQQHKAEPFKPAYLNYLHEHCMAGIWPFATGVDIPFGVLDCVSRVFRTYVLQIAPAKTKEEAQNAAAGALLAVQDYLGYLPKKDTEAHLVCALFDELPLTSKGGILKTWQAMKAYPGLLKSKCGSAIAAAPAAPA